MKNNSLFENEIIKWEFTIFTSQSNNIIYVYESAVHYGSLQIGYGPCSVHIHENRCITVITLMQKLPYMILKFILDNQLENSRTA